MSNVNIERRTFMPDAQFVQVFGEVSFPDEMECGKEMNIKFIDTKPQVQEASEEQEISNFANGFDIPFDVVE